jgi:hypothetical protein
MQELSLKKDNKAIAMYVDRRAELTDTQRLLIVETYLLQCISKIAGIENVIGKKIVI